MHMHLPAIRLPAVIMGTERRLRGAVRGAEARVQGWRAIAWGSSNRFVQGWMRQGAMERSAAQGKG